MTMIRPTVSIIMPTFNRLEFIPCAVESVLAQSLEDWELIIADDGSDDETLAYLRRLTNDPRVRLLELAHTGNAGKARNAAIAEARAPWLAFLDSDDLWLCSKLERQLTLLESSTECGWSYTAFVIVDADGTPLASERSRPWTPHTGDIFVQTVRTTASIRPSSVVARAALVRSAGLFDEAIDCSEDYDLWMRLALLSPTRLVDEVLIKVRRHAGSDDREPGRAHAARDYSLRKLAGRLTGWRKALVAAERSRNALAMSAELSRHGRRWSSVTAVAASLAFSWRFPRWWYGAAKAAARAIVAPGAGR